VLCASQLASGPVARWQAYERAALAPWGGGLAKDLSAWALCLVPRVGRLVKGAPSAAALESFHDEGGLDSRAMSASEFWTENFYIWAHSVSSADATFGPNAAGSGGAWILTTRLSFYGVNGSKVVPWFHIARDGERWNLPGDFESLVPRRVRGGAMEAVCALGALRFRVEEPLRRWRVTYEGELERLGGAGAGERRRVSADFVLHMRPENVFKYQVHWDELAAGRAMAGKPWTASFWANLRAQNQERYASQAVSAQGRVAIGSQPPETVQLWASRDHNFGVRNWRFIWRYIWWPPVKFHRALRIEGVEYSYLTGAMTEYGNTFANLVVGGVMSDDGRCAAFAGATPMREIARDWYDARSARGVPLGARTLPNEFRFRLAILEARYALDVVISRDQWTHAFLLDGGSFEIHEGMARWDFALRRLSDSALMGSATADGLFEFGANLWGFDDSTGGKTWAADSLP
jgi:hypothetical protein